MIEIKNLEKVKGQERDHDHVIGRMKYISKEPEIGEKMWFYFDKDNLHQYLCTSKVVYIEKETSDFRIETKNSTYRFRITGDQNGQA